MDVTLSHREFRALSSDTRTKILKLLEERNHTMSEISKKLGLAVPTVKQHLDMLCDAGLIEHIEDHRKWKYFSLSRKGRGIFQKNESTNILIVMAATFVALAVMLFNLVGQLGKTSVPFQVSEAMSAAPLAAGKAADSALRATGTAPQAMPGAASFDPAFLSAAIVLALAVFLAYLFTRLSKKRETI